MQTLLLSSSHKVLYKMAYNVYDINFSRFVRWWTAYFLRKPLLLTLLGVLVYPVAQLHQVFLRFRTAKLYQLKITPQVCYLEMMLNDSFDNTARGIYIEDAIWHLPTYIYQEAELKPVYLAIESEAAPVYVYTESEAGEFRDDFVVKVPATVLFNIEEMKGKIDSYKLAGTHYKIQIV